jgi:protease IV
MTKRRWTKHRPLFTSPVPAHVRKPKIHMRALPIFWLALKRTCMVLGAFTLFIIILSYWIATSVSPAKKPALPREMVLVLNLDDDPGEIPEPRTFATTTPTVHELIDAIDRAADDKRVKGIYARMEAGTFSISRSEELRAAIKRFEAAGKFAYIYSSSYGQGAGDLGRYYVASAFKEIWMQPMGIVSIAGIRAEIPFVRDVLDKIGIQPQFYKRKEYKTAYESFTNSEMSDANREEMQELVDDIRSQILKDIPVDRGMNATEFSKLVDHGLFTAPEALENKLVTNLDYADVLVDRIKKDVKGTVDADDSMFVDIANYAQETGWEQTERDFVKESFGGWRPAVALVYITGAIVDTNMGSDSGIAAADEIAPAILEAAEDDNIEGIVLRIDSPGGSPVASETILRAIEKAKQKGKPIIVSMGPTAASGGYWVAAYADQIFALPTTLTGSIGVLGGKISAAKLWEKVGVNWDKSIQWGQNAGMWSLNTPFSESEAVRINAMLDHVYASFIARVAKGRGLSPEQVDKIAKGRVWTGMRALKIGLVDQLGGLREALDYTAQILEKKNKNEIDVIVMPKPKTAFERLMALMEDDNGLYQGVRTQQRIAKFLGPWLRDAAVFKDGYATYEPLKIE